MQVVVDNKEPNKENSEENINDCVFEENIGVDDGDHERVDMEGKHDGFMFHEQILEVDFFCYSLIFIIL